MTYVIEWLWMSIEAKTYGEAKKIHIYCSFAHFILGFLLILFLFYIVYQFLPVGGLAE